MFRSLPLLVAAMLLLAGCMLPAPPTGALRAASGPIAVVATQPTATPLPSLAERPQPTLPSSRSGAPETVEVTASPTLAGGPHGVTAAPTVPATSTPTPKPGPDEPFAYVERYRAESEVLLDTIPALPQLRNLSCEAATMRMVLAARGITPSEEEVLQRMGQSDDPRQGFRGDVDGDGHDPELSNYGVYAEVVERVLRSYGVPATAVHGMSDSQLRETVRGGQAVIVWVSARENPHIIEQDGYRLVEEEHVYVVVGLLKDGRLLVHDPWGVRADSGRVGTFPIWVIRQWDLFDRQAVVVPLS